MQNSIEAAGRTFPGCRPIVGNAISPRRDWACEQVIALVAQQKDISIRLLVHPSRCRTATARARQLAMYLSHVVLGRTLHAVGAAFGRDRTTVSYACALIEDMRDDRAFDDEVSGLEQAIEAVLAANREDTDGAL